MIVTLGKDVTCDRCVLDRDEGFAWMAELKAALATQIRGVRTKSSVRRFRELRELIRSLERAFRTVVVLCDDTVVTTYRC